MEITYGITFKELFNGKYSQILLLLVFELV
jgi:hypothetical protein